MIYVITHKIFNTRNIDTKHYQVLHVGENKDYEESYLIDNVKINISNKNPYYCELTGLYWIWKNIQESNDAIIGISHYRRYFTTKKEYLKYKYLNVLPDILSWHRIEEALINNDIILPTRLNAIRKVKDIYSIEHCGEDLNLLRDSLKNISPEYLLDYEKFLNASSYWYANMMICRRETFDKYCSWLFAILADLEKRINISKYRDNYQRRVYGFLAERLLNVWVIHENLKVIEYPVFNTEKKDETFIGKNVGRVKRIIRKK